MKKVYLSQLTKAAQKALKSAWLFPFLAISFVLIMSALRISGTSMGVFDYYFGENHNSSIVGEPRSVRSDEWGVGTPFAIRQSAQNFPMHDTTLGAGQDMSVVIDAPYKDWSSAFRPQNLAFFFMPLENAFSFKWWFIAASLVIGVYVFVLLIYPKRYLLASLISLFFFFSPFLHWWYQAGTFMSIAYGLFILVLVLRILLESCRWKTFIYFMLLSYSLICFALLMYPAFQIPIVLVIAGIFVAILHSSKQIGLLLKKRSLILLVSSLLLAAAVVGLYIYEHMGAISSILHTVYPGSRSIQSGGFSPYSLLTWPLSYLLLNDSTSNIFLNNQSESSSFLLVAYIMLPFLIFFSYRFKNTFSRLEKYLLAFSFIATLIIAVRFFAPFGSELFSLFGLSSVPHVRLVIALGIINMVILAVAVGRRNFPIKASNDIFSLRLAVITLIIFLIYVSIMLAVTYGLKIEGISSREIFLCSATFAVASSFVLSCSMRLRYFGLVLLIGVGIMYSGLINPLYKGVALPNNPAVKYIQSTEKDDSHYWVVNDSIWLSAILISSGAEMHGGVNSYPQLEVWQKTFPGQENIFNRFAHIRFEFDSALPKPQLQLIQSDLFKVKLSPCDPFMYQKDIRYIISEQPVSGSCLSLIKHTSFSKKVLYVYRLL